MKVLILLFVAVCCVAAAKANSSDIKSIKNGKTNDAIDKKLKVNITEKQDKKNQKDSEGDKKDLQSACIVEEKDKVKSEKDKIKSEKEKNRKDGGSNESGSSESGSSESGSNESGSNESRCDDSESNENKTKDKKRKGGRNGRDSSSEEDRSDSRGGKGKKGKKDKHQHGGKKPCGKPTKPACNTLCTLEIAPLCASPDGFEGDSKTFDNECLLNLYNCQNPKAKYTKTSDGVCKPICPQFCPLYVKLFCAVPDGWCAEPRSFGNPCLLGVYNCENPNNKYKYFHDGDCLTTPAPEPDCGLIDCPQDVSPFCAFPDGFSGEPRTFNNKCLLEVYNCFNPNEQYIYEYEGECTTTPAPEPCIETDCPDDANTICGLPDGFCGQPKTFANGCYMKVYNTFNSEEQYEYFHDGECLTTPEPEPNCAAISCSNEGPAICGLPDGVCGPPQTFTNGCNLKVYNCFNPDATYKYFHDGECFTTPAPEPNCAAISCSNEGPALCGLPDGFCGPPQTFTNGCNLEVHNCFNPDAKYKYFHDGECIEQPNKCPTVCPYNYQPICANGQSGNVLTFPNECSLEQQNCLNENDQYTFAHEGECDECADIKCNKIGQLICATNSENVLQTFGNPCMLQQYNCDNCNDKFAHLYDGSCIEPVVCTKEYIPVCAVSPTLGPRTFSNKCERDVYISQNPDDGFVAAYDGECTSVCRLGCPRIYDPRCGIGINGEEKEFSNQCEYEKYNCLNPNEQYDLGYEGKCNNCATACIEIYDPVCTYDAEGNEKQYSNECELSRYNCIHQNYQSTVAYAGECRQCNSACIEIYDPVCTYDSAGNEKQYSNQCELDSYNCIHQDDQCTLAYAGECRQCNVACIALYAPVCAYDSAGNEKQYSNQCELDSYNCIHQDDQCTLAYQAECNNCRLGCPKIYAPVCTVDSAGKERQFGNQCELDSWNCIHKDDQCSLSYEGECHECNTGCPDVYDPVCAVNGAGDEVKFSNQCDLDNYNCRYPFNPVSVSYTGECHQCQTMCPAIYNPVCVKDISGTEITVGSQCEVNSYNCRYPYMQYSLQYQGECKKECVKPCPKILAEICAKDGAGNTRTFSNECEMENYNCGVDCVENKFTKSKDGKCGPSCNDNCPADVKPVCASSNGDCKCSDARTFLNQCLLDSYNCHNPKKALTKAADGECPVECKRLKCTQSEQYICATSSDPKVKPSSFYNDCERVLHNCNNPKNKFYYSYDGKCPGGY